MFSEPQALSTLMLVEHLMSVNADIEVALLIRPILALVAKGERELVVEAGMEVEALNLIPVLFLAVVAGHMQTMALLAVLLLEPVGPAADLLLEMRTMRVAVVAVAVATSMEVAVAAVAARVTVRERPEVWLTLVLVAAAGGGVPLEDRLVTVAGMGCCLGPSVAGLVEVARLVPELRALRPDLPAPPPLSGHGAQQRLFEAVARFLEALAQPSRPDRLADSVILFLDGLPWVDHSRLYVLQYLARLLSGIPLLIVSTYAA